MKNLSKNQYKNIANMEEVCDSIEAGTEKVFIPFANPNIANFAKNIKETASYKYYDKMSAKESKFIGKMYDETEWNRLYLSILRLAADGLDTLVIVNPCREEKLIKKLRQAGFKLNIEKVPDETLRSYGHKNAMAVKRIIVKW